MSGPLSHLSDHLAALEELDLSRFLEDASRRVQLPEGEETGTFLGGRRLCLFSRFSITLQV